MECETLGDYQYFQFDIISKLLKTSKFCSTEWNFSYSFRYFETIVMQLMPLLMNFMGSTHRYNFYCKASFCSRCMVYISGVL